MDQFGAPNWPPKPLKSASRGAGKFWTRGSKKLLVPRRSKMGQDGPKEPKIAPSWPKKAPKIAPRWGKLGQDGSKLLQNWYNKAPKLLSYCYFCSFLFLFLFFSFSFRMGGLPRGYRVPKWKKKRPQCKKITKKTLIEFS